MDEQVTRPWLDLWGTCAEHYERFRPGPPPSYYDILASLGCGLAGQTVIDLGTGPGLVACELAKRGARVIAVDRSNEQIFEAGRRARRIGVDVDLRVGMAEELEDLGEPLDLAIANMCWGYFDQLRILEWLLRQLSATGLLAVSRFSAVYSHPMAELVVNTLRAFGVERSSRAQPGPLSHKRFVSDPRFQLRALVYYEEPVEFSIDAWVGRWRASKHVGRDIEVADAFAERLRTVLRATLTEPFSVEHFVNLEVYAPVMGALPHC